MPRRPWKVEGQVVGGMRRWILRHLPRPREGLDWVAHFSFPRQLFRGAVSPSALCFSFLFYLDLYPVPHVTGLGGFPAGF